MRAIQYSAAVKNADALKALGQHELYLSEGAFPWDKADSCEPGGTNRLDMATSVWFSADDPCGIRFRWSFDIESRAANGTSSYAIDTAACRDVMKLLPEGARQQFRDYLLRCAEKVQAKGAEYQAIADKQWADACLLRKIAQD